MASVVEWPAGRSFEFTVFKHMTQNAEKKWVNTYWARSLAGGTIWDLVDLAHALCLFEQDIHLPVTWIDRVEVRTGARDGDPYNPTSFFSYPFGEPGQRAGAQGDPVGLGLACWMGKAVPYGREGRNMYRGMLTEGDCWAPSGQPVPQSQAGLQTLVSDAISASGLNEYMGIGSDPNLEMVVLGKNGEYPRRVLWFEVRGLTEGRKNRGWYNRNPSTVPNSYPDELDPDQIAPSVAAIASMPVGFVDDMVDRNVTPEWDPPVAP